jgi:hypothetical protein
MRGGNRGSRGDRNRRSRWEGVCPGPVGPWVSAFNIRIKVFIYNGRYFSVKRLNRLTQVGWELMDRVGLYIFIPHSSNREEDPLAFFYMGYYYPCNIHKVLGEGGGRFSGPGG